MNYVNFGRTGVHVSPLGVGCLTYGGKTAQPEADRMVAHAIARGINFFDTSNSYGRGRSEEALGEALRSTGQRARVILATKVHHPIAAGPNESGNSRRHIVEQCDASLRRLRTEWIDVYQIHRPLSATPIDETLQALDDLIRAGKIRYAGTSCFAAWQIVESLMVSRQRRLHRFASEQAPLHLLDRSIERELLPMARTFGTAVVAFGPLAGGVLTGKYVRGVPAALDTRHAQTNHPHARFNHRLDPEQPWWDVVAALRELAHRKGVSLAHFALAWACQQPGVTVMLIGPRTFEQLSDNLASLEVTLSAEELAAVDVIVPPGRQTMPYYEVASPLENSAGRNFGPHPYPL